VGGRAVARPTLDARAGTPHHPGAYLAEVLPPVDLDEHTDAMARHGLCLVGIHHWVQLRNADGEPYIECTRCGQYREPERPMPPIA